MGISEGGKLGGFGERGENGGKPCEGRDILCIMWKIGGGLMRNPEATFHGYEVAWLPPSPFACQSIHLSLHHG